LSSNHLIWYEINRIMIGFIMLFILNVLQKPTLIIIIFLIFGLMKNIKLHPRIFFEDVHVFNTFQIYIFNLTEDTLETCNLI